MIKKWLNLKHAQWLTNNYAKSVGKSITITCVTRKVRAKGFVDYTIFVGTMLVSLIEAKATCTNIRWKIFNQYLRKISSAVYFCYKLKEVKLEDLMTLEQIYNVKKLEYQIFEKETRIQVATVQSMVSTKRIAVTFSTKKFQQTKKIF